MFLFQGLALGAKLEVGLEHYHYLDKVLRKHFTV